MKIEVNGELMEVVESTSIESLLDHLKLSQDRVAVELNRSIIEREMFHSLLVHEGDQIEIIGFVGGGNGSGGRKIADRG